MNASELIRKIEGIEKRLTQSPLLNERGFEGLSKVKQEIELLKYKISQPLKVAVIGEVKSGKSTLINAFANGIVAPTNVTEATACIMQIAYSEQSRAVLVYKDGNKIENSVDVIYNVLRQNENNQAFFVNCSHIEVYMPLSGLRKIQLIDTPGLATITTANEEVTRKYFQNIDVVLWVFNGHYLGQSDVNDELRTVARMGKPIVGVINRIDEIDADPEDLINYVDDNLGIYLKQIFAISAYNAFEGITKNNSSLLSDSRFIDLQKYLLEKIERCSDTVLVDSINNSAEVLNNKLLLLHQQVLEQIDLKLSNYEDIDNQMRRSSSRLKERVVNFTENWIHSQYLQRIIDDYNNKIDSTSIFSAIDPNQLRQNIIADINESTPSEFSDFLGNLQTRISQEWKDSLVLVDKSIADLYDYTLQKQSDIRINYYNSVATTNSVTSDVTENILKAGAVGTGLAFYTAVLGPSAAYVSIGTALGSIMPPVLLAGACVGGIQMLMKKKQTKTRNQGILNNIMHEARLNMENNIVPMLNMKIDELCSLTCERARNEFVKRNFDGRSYEELQILNTRLKDYLKNNGDIYLLLK